MGRSLQYTVSAMNCPLGHGPLQPEQRLGLDVEVCATCGGEWLDRHELGALEAVRVRDPFVLRGMIEYQPHPAGRDCPVCLKAMYEFDYRGNPLQLDACPDGDGYWLDGGEGRRVGDLIQQRARDLDRAASAEASFGSFINKLRGQLGGRGRRR